MYYYLLRRCFIIIYLGFIIYPEYIFSINIPIKRANKFQSGNSVNGKNSQSGISEEQRRRLKLWPRGVIQYFIDDYSFDKVLRDKIRTFLEDTSTKTGEALQFVELPYPPKNDQEKWVLFINRVGQLDCADSSPANFSERGVQRVLLGYDCLNEGDGGLAAIVLALAGVPPQHNAPNRNEYITIMENNILQDKKDLFRIVPESDWVFSPYEYDFASASHYDFYKYTSNGQATIKPLENVEIPVGEPTGLSPTDIEKITYLYQNSKSDLSPEMKSDCSKLYKPGTKISVSAEDSDQKRDLPEYENISNGTGLMGPSSVRASKKRLKSAIEKEMDYDTDKII